MARKDSWKLLWGGTHYRQVFRPTTREGDEQSLPGTVILFRVVATGEKLLEHQNRLEKVKEE